MNEIFVWKNGLKGAFVLPYIFWLRIACSLNLYAALYNLSAVNLQIIMVSSFCCQNF